MLFHTQIILESSAQQHYINEILKLKQCQDYRLPLQMHLSLLSHYL